MFGRHIGVPFHNKCVERQLNKRKPSAGQTRDPQNMKRSKTQSKKYLCMRVGLFITGKSIPILASRVYNFV